ncbi:hypothetical protein ACFOY8_14160 [Thalassospira xianhensis]|uniref:Uncharacterized protein n=1 Tax=Thalassospira xianhensis MCCC 1A02616 TaxID=1177929 RepID=A0A367UHQ7_9PROT|nr:hypothetical protein [Thalassospira xianhensis]RCK07699.1 hypothetical protein TH5_01105 [Thalassospira xianhensis MCCC 1A02616]
MKVQIVSSSVLAKHQRWDSAFIIPASQIDELFEQLKRETDDVSLVKEALLAMPVGVKRYLSVFIGEPVGKGPEAKLDQLIRRHPLVCKAYLLENQTEFRADMEQKQARERAELAALHVEQTEAFNRF